MLSQNIYTLTHIHTTREKERKKSNYHERKKRERKSTHIPYTSRSKRKKIKEINK